MGKAKSKDSTPEPSSAVKFLFAADNPFRRRTQSGPAPSHRPPPELGLGLGFGPISAARAAKEEKPVNGGADAAEVRKRKREEKGRSPNPSSAGDLIPTKRKKKVETDDDGESPKKKRKKRKRDEIEEEYEKRTYGAAAEEEEEQGGGAVVPVGGKRKAADASKEMLLSRDSYDDESKLVRTVFVGNLPLKTKRKALLKEFARFGEVESVRIRSVPLIDSKVPRKGAVIKGKINDAVDCVHAYIVFKDEQSAHAALSNNMAQFGGNHIRVDTACPPRKKLKGEGPLYDRKRTVFVGNLPFDVKDEELYQLFCGDHQSESSVEAVRVIRDPNTSLGKGIAYVLFKTRDAATSVVKKRNLKIRDRALRLCYAKSADAVPSKRTNPKQKREIRQKKLAATSSGANNGKPKVKAASLSYQGLRSSKTGVLKKSSLRPQSSNHGSHGTKRAGEADQQVRKAKRPAVAVRKAKQLLKKRKQETGTPANTHRNKKARRY